MKIKLLLILSVFALTVNAGWQESSSNWSAEAADDAKKKASNALLGDGGTTDTIKLGSSALGAISDYGGALGMSDELTGLAGSGSFALGLIANDTYSQFLSQTAFSFLGADQQAFLEKCYTKVSFKSGDSVSLDVCSLLPDIPDFCGTLPDIPGFSKKEADPLQLFGVDLDTACDKWVKIAGGKIKGTSTKEKILEKDVSASMSRSIQVADSSLVTQKIKRTTIAEASSVSGVKFDQKDKSGKTITVTPLKGLETQDTQEKVNAQAYLKDLVKEAAAEGKSEDEIKEIQMLAVANANKVNVAFKNEHEYEQAVREAIDSYHFIEEGVFNIESDLSKYKQQVIKFESEMDDVGSRLTAIKNEKDNFVIQYSQRVDEWVNIQTIYYFKYRKKGIKTPTKSLIEAMTKKSDNKSIARPALVYQVETEMNHDVQEIVNLKIKAGYLKAEFERRLEIIIAANRKFDIEAAMKSVGL